MSSAIILNKVSGLSPQNDLSTINTNVAGTPNHAPSGQRINSGPDEAALQVTDTLRADVRALQQRIKNANDAVAAAQLEDGALAEISDLLTRAAMLAAQAATLTVDSIARASLHAEFAQIRHEITRIASRTGSQTHQVSANSGLGATLSLAVGDISGAGSISAAISTITASGQAFTDLKNENLSAMDLTTPENAAVSLTGIRSALNGTVAIRAEIGTGISRLHTAVSALQNQARHPQDFAIQDGNQAWETASLVKNEILAHSNAAASTQANLNSEVVLDLISRDAGRRFAFSPQSTR
jgi:flagellin